MELASAQVIGAGIAAIGVGAAAAGVGPGGRGGVPPDVEYQVRIGTVNPVFFRSRTAAGSALIGVAGVHNKVKTTGFETIGWTNPNLSAAQCGDGNVCNTTGGGNWTIPATVPANAGNGLTTGATIDEALLTLPGELEKRTAEQASAGLDSLTDDERAQAVAKLQPAQGGAAGR